MFDCLTSCNLCCLGKVVRELKAHGGDKSQIDLEVKKLLELKGQYKLLAGREWTSSAGGGGGTKKKERGEAIPSGLKVWRMSVVHTYICSNTICEWVWTWPQWDYSTCALQAQCMQWSPLYCFVVFSAQCILLNSSWMCSCLYCTVL